MLWTNIFAGFGGQGVLLIGQLLAYAEQAKKIPRPVFLVNSICDADNTRGGCYAFLNGKTVCEVPMGQDGYLLVRV